MKNTRQNTTAVMCVETSRPDVCVKACLKEFVFHLYRKGSKAGFIPAATRKAKCGVIIFPSCGCCRLVLLVVDVPLSVYVERPFVVERLQPRADSTAAAYRSCRQSVTSGFNPQRSRISSTVLHLAHTDEAPLLRKDPERVTS